jgi:hypothetical protein
MDIFGESESDGALTRSNESRIAAERSDLNSLRYGQYQKISYNDFYRFCISGVRFMHVVDFAVFCSEALGRLLEDQTASDITFYVGTEKIPIKAHKAILVARSEYFRFAIEIFHLLEI